jgi:signal transduction histidine kinase
VAEFLGWWRRLGNQLGSLLGNRLGTIRVRTTIAATVVVGVALTVGGLILVMLLRSAMIENVQLGAEARAEDLAALLAAGTPPAALPLDDGDASIVQVLNTAGAVVAASSNVAGRPPIANLLPEEARTLQGLPVPTREPYRVVARDTPDGRYLVLVGSSLEPVAEETRVVGLSLLVGLPLLLVLVAATTWGVTGMALRPVERIRRRVAEISDTELDRRVPEPAGDDEIARLARTMNAMLDRLHASRDRQRRFVSDASHELRSPIASIRNQIETALAQLNGTRTEALLADLLAEDLRMQALVEDLLLLARADEQNLTAVARPVDLDDLVLDEARRLRERGVVRVDTREVSAGRVVGDAAALQRLVRNLADNAERHARSAVHFAVATHGARVTLSVSDDGPGVPVAERQRIFERFVRLDDARARDTGGAGLGLAIVAAVAGAHRGTVHVEGTNGARFVVVLPAADGE